MAITHKWRWWLIHFTFLAVYIRCWTDAFRANHPRRSFNRGLGHRQLTTSEDSSKQIFALCMAGSRIKATQQSLEERWIPKELLPHEFDDFRSEEEALDKLQASSIQLLATLIQYRLNKTSNSTEMDPPHVLRSHRRAYLLAKGRFPDLTCEEEGEQLLEQMFDDDDASKEDENVIQGAIIALQSLLVFAMQLGQTGTAEQLQRYVAHMADSRDADNHVSSYASSVRRLKYRRERAAGVQLLAKLKMKRTPQRAYDLLVQLGVWTKHEDLVLLRSGFSLRFSDETLEAALAAKLLNHDPDTLLELRQDLHHQKVYTIDGEGAQEIDDGLGVEVIEGDDGSERYRYWIHIADADRWAPRSSEIFEVARERGVSLYLPQGSIPMFPSSLSKDVMSLTTNQDSCALSLGVELADDGSIIDSSIIVTPSTVRVSYKLTYDQVDEMLHEGIGFHEEWQLGALMAAASNRREFRIRNGSSEGFVPTQVPQCHVSTYEDKQSQDGIGIRLKVEVSHNGGKNQSLVEESSAAQYYAEPVSSASTLVTEMMILAGEAIGKWMFYQDTLRENTEASKSQILRNSIRLPFRTQRKPDYRSRAREKKIMMDLLEYNVGDGLCHAWYARRFLSPVKISEYATPHSGLGLECYAQWTSPIRRFSDLQVHCIVKRYLRRERVNKLIAEGKEIPSWLTSTDLGCEVPMKTESGEFVFDNGQFLDQDIDFLDRSQLLGVARTVQRQSQRYWLFEYIRRLKEKDPDITFDAVVLGCIDPKRRQYAIFMYELGLEYPYISPIGSLYAGQALRIKIADVFPRSRQLLLTQGDM